MHALILQVLAHLQFAIYAASSRPGNFGPFCLSRDMHPWFRTYITLLKTFIYYL